MTGGVGGLQGSLAEFAAVDADLLAKKPVNLTMREAAALPLVVLTAWEGMVDRANVRDGQKVLVLGGSGGVGHVAVQIAKARGAKVFATASAAKHDMVRQLGAVPIDYHSTSIEQIVLLPGWSQSAEQFKYQIPVFAEHYHVIAVDLRGHGESEKVSFGYRISRLSQDIQELIGALQLKKPHLLGHSMGCSLIWSYLDLFGLDEFDRLVLVDQSPLVISRSHWDAQEIAESGAVFTAEQLSAAVHTLENGNAEELTRNLLSSMVTPTMSKEQFEWIVECNFRCPRVIAATLLYNHAHTDWRDQIVRIRKPTLIIAGRKSLIPWTSQVWINQSIPGSELEIFEAAEGGGHFTFIENPEKFNRRVLQFLS